MKKTHSEPLIRPLTLITLRPIPALFLRGVRDYRRPRRPRRLLSPCLRRAAEARWLQKRLKISSGTSGRKLHHLLFMEFELGL